MKKAQGALEYLLLIGGAILVAVIVITILGQSSGQTGKQTEINAINALCLSKTPQDNPPTADLECIGGSNVTIGSTICDCAWNNIKKVCDAREDDVLANLCT